MKEYNMLLKVNDDNDLTMIIVITNLMIKYDSTNDIIYLMKIMIIDDDDDDDSSIKIVCFVVNLFIN